MLWTLKSIVWGLTGSISASYILCLANAPLAAIIITSLFYLRPFEKALYPYPIAMVALLITMFVLVFHRKPYSVIKSHNRNDTKLFFLMQGYLMFNTILFNRWNMLDIYQSYIIPAALLFFLISEFVVTTKHLKMMLLAIGIPALLICADSLYVHFLVDQSSKVWLLYHLGESKRLLNLGWWDNPNKFAYLSVIGILCFFTVSSVSNGVTRFVYLLPCLALLPSLFLTGSRAALLQLCVSGFVFFMLGKKSVGSIVFVSSIVFVAVTYLTVLSPERKYAEGSKEQRLEILYYAKDAFKTHPVLGIGFRSFPDYNPFHLVTHNTYVQVFTELGIVGATIFFLMLKTILKGAYSTMKNTASQKEFNDLHKLSKGILALTLGTFVYYLFGNQLMSFTFCTTIALLVVVKRAYEVRLSSGLKINLLEK